MYTRPDQNENQRRQLLIGDPKLVLQAFCVLGITLIDAFKELLTLFPVFRVGIDLIHQSVLLAVFFRRPVWDLVNESP